MAASARKSGDRLASARGQRSSDGTKAAAGADQGAVPSPPPDPDERRYQSGDVIAEKYRLDSAIGQGGMGAVWRAQNLVLDVTVAIKLINRQVASEEARKRLLIEARAAAQLAHPSIVRVHDFGTTERGDPFIVMEHLRGEALASIVDRKGALEPTASVRLTLPVLAALVTAHNKGIVHRDIKPDNIILGKDENGNTVPKLVDFGIAKVSVGSDNLDEPSDDSDEVEAAGRLARRLTQSGRIVGSPDYMSPEQARGDDVDARSDLWSLAVVLYEAMTGLAPFHGASVDQVLIDVLVGEPASTTSLGIGDASLWQILKRALTKRKEHRWQSAREMGHALATWLLTQGVDTDITGASVREHWLEGTSSAVLSTPPPSPGESADTDPHGTRATPPSLDAPVLPRSARGTVRAGPTPSAPASGSAPAPTRRRRLGVAAVVVVPTVIAIAALVLLWGEPAGLAPAGDLESGVTRSSPAPAVGESAAVSVEPSVAATTPAGRPLATASATAVAGTSAAESAASAFPLPKGYVPAPPLPPAPPPPTTDAIDGKGPAPIPEVPNF